MTKTLQQILNEQKKSRKEQGTFGIDECKKAIKWQQNYSKVSLYQLLEEYVERANKDVFFNKTMVLACWELINE